jgi:hypothetical protein
MIRSLLNRLSHSVSRGWSLIQTEGTPRRNAINQSE